MGMFDEIELENGLESKDVVGGGGFAKFDKTGFYAVEIEKAYAGTSSGGAFSVTLHLKDERGAKLTHTEYISSGTAKGCKNYYLDRNGNKQYLPGYNKIKNLDALLGFDRSYPNTTKGNVMLWDKDLKKEVPQEREVISEWIGKKIGILGKVTIEDKYGDETKSREYFDIEHFVDAVTKKTRNEIVAGTDGFYKKFTDTFDENYIVDNRKLSIGSSSGSGESNTPTVDTDEIPF